MNLHLSTLMQSVVYRYFRGPAEFKYDKHRKRRTFTPWKRDARRPRMEQLKASRHKQAYINKLTLRIEEILA